MLKHHFLPIADSDAGGSLKKRKVSIVTRDGHSLPRLVIIGPVVSEPSLPQGPFKTVEVVNAKAALLLGPVDYVPFY
jgi:hypothetical protein